MHYIILCKSVKHLTHNEDVSLPSLSILNEAPHPIVYLVCVAHKQLHNWDTSCAISHFYCISLGKKMCYVTSLLESQTALHNTKQKENAYLVKWQVADQFFNYMEQH